MNLPETQGFSIPSPRELMRTWRPNLYSDTQKDTQRALSREAFDHHLETLTSRSQEKEFEHLCRVIAQKQLCPNLRKQTGPTGGGDSKVDSETFPVSKAIAERWWFGNNGSANERWAFAFSAKKEWKPKVKSDVASIQSTARDYRQIYFITNQYARDKDRAALEDSLSKEIAVPVTILDRTWLLEAIYEHNHIEIAMQALGILDGVLVTTTVAGPRDTARENELRRLDVAVADPDCYEHALYQLTEDCLRSAVLARGLERPNFEIDARFAHAQRLAERSGVRRQQLRVTYTYAWSAYWWLEDFSLFNRLIEEVEVIISDSTDAYDLELFQNLLLLLEPLVRAQRLTPEAAQIEQRVEHLRTLYTPLVADTNRPNNAFEARVGLNFMNLYDSLQRNDTEQLNIALAALPSIIESSHGLGRVSVDRISKYLTVLGKVIDNNAFDKVFDDITTLVSERNGEGEAGTALLERGDQKLQQKKPFDAIRYFGRAEKLLVKKEFRETHAQALMSSAEGYRQAGLYWAARSKSLAAVECLLSDLEEHGKLTLSLLSALHLLVWAELTIGRLPQTLNSLKLLLTLRSQMVLPEEALEQHGFILSTMEIALAKQILHIAPSQLNTITFLPDLFDSLQLYVAGFATLYSLGHGDTLIDEGYLSADQSQADVESFITELIDAPMHEQIRKKPILCADKDVHLESVILGCRLCVVTEASVTGMGIIESVLGALEAFLSTSNEAALLPQTEVFHLHLRCICNSDDRENTEPAHQWMKQGGFPGITLEVPFGYEPGFEANRASYQQWLFDVIINIVGRIFYTADTKKWLEQVVHKESGIDRAFLTADAVTLNRLVFGNDVPIALSEHAKLGDRYFIPKRQHTLVKDPVVDDEIEETIVFGDGEPPPGTIPERPSRHDQQSIFTPIDAQTWDRAGWHGVAFLEYQYPPPFLCLMFKHEEAAKEIFCDWIDRWGENGSDEYLRLSLVTGLNKVRSDDYAVVISPSLNLVKKHSGALLVSRINRMDNANPENLQRFLNSYERMKSYRCGPIVFNNQSTQPRPYPELSLQRTQLEVRAAWTIGDNDPDMCALQPDDDPFVPLGVVDPPCHAALRRLQASRDR